MIVVAIGRTDWMVAILTRRMTEPIAGGLGRLAANVHLRKVTVKLGLLHTRRTTENVPDSRFQILFTSYTCTDLGLGAPKL